MSSYKCQTLRLSDSQTRSNTSNTATHHITSQNYCLFIAPTIAMTSNGKWKNNFKDFFFEKGAESAEKLKDNAEDALTNGCSSSETGKEDVEDQTDCETVNGNSEELEGLTDESKSLLENPPPGTLKGRLFRMFSKPADGRDDEGEQSCANDDDDKTVVTNGAQTKQVQMVDKAVSTEDKDDIPKAQKEEEDGNTESSDGPVAAAAPPSETSNGSKAEEKKRFRFQLFSK